MTSVSRATVAATNGLRARIARFLDRLHKSHDHRSNNRAGFELLETRLLFAAVSWDGGGDGASWGDRFNWSADALPTSNDDVTINVAGSPTVTYSTGSTTVKSLTSAEAIVISGGTLTTGTNGASLSSSTTISGGTLTLGGSWSNSGTITVSSGTVNLGGSFSTSGLGTWSRSGGTVNLTGTL